MTNSVKFKVFRYDLKKEQHTKYSTYSVPIKPGYTTLDALFYIQRKIDDGLAFRYSCRGAVCGSCAMLINRYPQLACKTQVTTIFKETQKTIKRPDLLLPTDIKWDPQTEIIIEPLPNFKIIKDLVVDLNPFFDKLERIKPWIQGTSSRADVMTRELSKKLERVANCFLCAACYGACPINSQHIEYLGPAALARAWRFVEDPADETHQDRLRSLNSKPEGALGCEFYYNCVKVCPRKVAPAQSIRLLQEKMKK